MTAVSDGLYTWTAKDVAPPEFVLKPLQIALPANDTSPLDSLSDQQESPPPLNSSDVDDETPILLKKSVLQIYTQIFQILSRKQPQTLRQSAQINALFQRHINLYIRHRKEEESIENEDILLTQLLEQVPYLHNHVYNCIPMNKKEAEQECYKTNIHQIDNLLASTTLMVHRNDLFRVISSEIDAMDEQLEQDIDFMTERWLINTQRKLMARRDALLIFK